ncbi:MAG: metal ABC transporter substrate-binding protein [Planctomycetota bacterium]
MTRLVLTLACSIGVLGPAGCGDRSGSAAPAGLEQGLVITSTPVAAALLRELVPESMTVEVVVPEGADPLGWQADDAAVVRLRQAELIVFHGTGPERWSRTLSLPSSRIHLLADTVRTGLILSEEAITHSHGLGGEHSHREPVFGTWLDPAMLRPQGEQLVEALIRIEPGQETLIRANLAAWIGSLREASAVVERMRSLEPRSQLVADREGYAYLARALRLDLVDPEDVDETRPSVWFHGGIAGDDVVTLGWPDPLEWSAESRGFGETLAQRLASLEQAIAEAE